MSWKKSWRAASAPQPARFTLAIVRSDHLRSDCKERSQKEDRQHLAAALIHCGGSRLDRKKALATIPTPHHPPPRALCRNEAPESIRERRLLAHLIVVRAAVGDRNYHFVYRAAREKMRTIWICFSLRKAKRSDKNKHSTNQSSQEAKSRVTRFFFSAARFFVDLFLWGTLSLSVFLHDEK